MFDFYSSGLVDTDKLWGALADYLAEPTGADPTSPNREQWGTGPRARRGARAMMALAAPPPGWPPKPAEEVSGDGHR